MQSSEMHFDRSVLSALRASIAGAVIAPADAQYDTARRVYLTSIDRRPAVIVRAADVPDVQQVVNVARASGTPIAVRNGGHSALGHGVSDGGIMLDVTALRQLEIDVAGRIARAGSGLTAGEYTTAVGAHGLATGFGDAPSVGIGGITVAGGVGFLHRRYGMTIDNVLGAEVVTAEGRLERADATTNPDLFWAIRGGGGNFGVVTRIEYRLQPVGPVLGGMLMLPASAERIVEVVKLAAAAPDELSAIVNVMTAPPLPFIPPEQHGRPVIMVLLVCVGELEAAERTVAPFRALARPLIDMVRPMRYPEVYQAEGGAPHPFAAALHTRFLEAFDVAGAERVIERLEAGTAPMRVAQFRPLGGAVARVPAEATAFAHRERRLLLNVAAAYEVAGERTEHERWVASLGEALDDGTRGAYVAFLGQDGAARIREAYPGATWDRLVSIKTHYDPANLFRNNHNIPPLAGG